MKVSIMTLSLSLNYGAQLQSYALAKTIANFGIEVEVYQYYDKHRITYGMTFTQKIKYYLWNCIRHIIGSCKKEACFKKFREQYVPMTKMLYKSNQELKNNPGDYDVFIAGSDQIWNPDIFKYDLSYFLDFVPPYKKKISYASSFAKKTFVSKFKKQCISLLNEFEYISVREQSGIEIVKELCSKQAKIVLDPTLLLDINDWRLITEKSSKKSCDFSGILCYVMPGDKKVTDTIEKIAQKIRKETGLSIMRLGIKEFEKLKHPWRECDTTASPSDFVSYFIGAKYVITNSFHGTAFAINFEKNLIVPYNTELSSKDAIHERIISLLHLVEATNVLWPVSEKYTCYKKYNMQRSSELLKSHRVQSLSYLRTALEV